MKRIAEGDHGSIVRDSRSIVTLELVAGIVVTKLNIDFSMKPLPTELMLALNYTLLCDSLARDISRENMAGQQPSLRHLPTIVIIKEFSEQ